MLAQDTGAAIKGPLRGDVYWGDGEMAEQSAGAMKSPGRFYLLLPIGVIPTASAGS
jgi:membrane-bound lytic murein transglycosylase A